QDVLVDGSSVGAVGTYTFSNVTANHTIAASFTVAVETITATAGTGGDISPSGAVSVNCGSNQTFTITPDGCHHINDVLVDGVSVGAVASYTFNSVTANHTIEAKFAVAFKPPTAGRLLRRRGRAGGRRLGGRGLELHVQQRDGQPHHRRELRGRRRGHHRLGRQRRVDQPERRGVGGVRQQPELHHHAGRLL